MWRTCGYSISLLVFFLAGDICAQDTIEFPLKIRVGFDISGPGIYFSDKNNLSLEGFISYDRNEKMALVLGGGYLDYRFSQYNYDYRCTGIFIRTGVDFNLLKPVVSAGRHQAGLGLNYGLSFFNPETSSFQHENYWGKVTSSIPKKTSLGHFLEVAPGVKAELFKNVSIGWTIRLRILISGGGGKDLRPIYFPGFGNGAKTVNAGFNYFITWNIQYKKIRVISKPEPVEEPEETEEELNLQQQP